MISRVLVLLFLPLLFAFNFSPMSQVINIGEGKKSAQFMLENGGASNMAVELTVKERKMNENGEETLLKTTELSVFPPQVIIPPREKRTIRVMYNGASDFSTEKSFRVIAEPLGLKVDQKTKEQAGIQVLMQYVAALYVSPKDAKSNIKIDSFTSTAKELTLVLKNDGNAHQLINNPVLKFAHEGSKGEFKSSDLKGLAGENVLAGQKRIFKITTSRVIPVGAKLDLKIND